MSAMDEQTKALLEQYRINIREQRDAVVIIIFCASNYSPLTARRYFELYTCSQKNSLFTRFATDGVYRYPLQQGQNKS